MYEALKKFEEALDLVNQGYQGKKQNGKATYYPRVVPESGEIKDTWSTDKIKRFINAMICPPLPYARYRGFEVKSYEQYLKIKNENRN
jgi:methionyl-tRNA formyltransferase